MEVKQLFVVYFYDSHGLASRTAVNTMRPLEGAV